jgi:hypothetical protein
MDVVLDTTCRNQSTVLIPKNATHVLEESRLDVVRDGWSSILGAEDRVKKQASE